MRILHFGPTKMGGVANGIIHLCSTFAQEGHEVGLLCNGGIAIDLLKGTDVQLFERKFVGGTRGILKEILPTSRIISSFRPDILHVHGRGPSLVSTLAGRYPDCFTLHNDSFGKPVGRIDSKLLRPLLSPLARKMIIMSEQQRSYCVTDMGLADRRIFMVPTGVDVEHFAPCSPERREQLRAELGVERDQLLFLYVGRLHPQKQPEAVVRLAEALRERGDDRVRFVMIGDGILEESIASDVARLGLEDRISLLGYRDPLTAYQAADLLLLPSLYEGYGLVAVEAMAAGCAVLRSRTAGFEEQIDEGETGYGCDVEIGDFVKQAIKIVDHFEDLRRIGVNARAKAVNDLSLSAQARGLIQVYQDHLQGRTRNAA